MLTSPRAFLLLFGALALGCGSGSSGSSTGTGTATSASTSTSAGTSTSSGTVASCEDVKAICDQCPVTGAGCLQALKACELGNPDKLGCCRDVADGWRVCPENQKFDAGAGDVAVGPVSGDCNTWAAGMTTKCPNQDKAKVASDCEKTLTREPACKDEFSAFYACMSTAPDLDCVNGGGPYSCKAQLEVYQACYKTKIVGGTTTPDAGAATVDASVVADARPADAVAAKADASDPNRLGPVDMTAYCASCCGGKAPALNAASNPPAYGWSCGGTSMDLNQACKTQYSLSTAKAKCDNLQDTNCWYCSR